ncbi:MAG: DNA replication/repair protein RecF [Catalinimonas sp.]
MHLHHLRLTNFKNYESFAVDDLAPLNVFVGDNGTGKTNLLDAIHYLSLTKSAFTHLDARSVRHGTDFFRLEGMFERDGERSVVTCALRPGEKKVFKVNQVPYERLSEHVGRFPLVLIAPDDTDLIRHGSEGRRRFFDALLSQLDAPYLRALMEYNHLLQQRNRLLKQFAARHFIDRTLLDAYDEPMLRRGQQIYECRRALIDRFVPVFLENYRHFCDEREEVSLRYTSSWENPDFAGRFRKTVNDDLQLQRTTLGVHRDDYVFGLGDHLMKRYGSQGQQKSFVVALKLAQFDLMWRETGRKPLLLLDDVFDKLDDRRIRHLMDRVADQSFGQIFLTDARSERTEKIFAALKTPGRIIRTTFTPLIPSA